MPLQPEILEVEVLDYIQDQLGGQREVRLKSGIADLVVGTSILEAKKYECWKALLGQVLSHKYCYPNRNLIAVAYCHHRFFPPYNLEYVRSVFSHHGIKFWVTADRAIKRCISRSTKKAQRRSSLAFREVPDWTLRDRRPDSFYVEHRSTNSSSPMWEAEKRDRVCPTGNPKAKT